MFDAKFVRAGVCACVESSVCAQHSKEMNDALSPPWPVAPSTIMRLLHDIEGRAAISDKEGRA